jgi:hypothetical protein
VSRHAKSRLGFQGDAAGRVADRSGGRYPRSVSAGRDAVRSLPTWAIWSIGAAVVLLSPVLAFLIAIGVEILIGVLYDAGLLPGLAVGAVGAIGWSLFRKLWVRTHGAAPVGT